MSESERFKGLVSRWHDRLRKMLKLVMGAFVFLSALAMVAVLALGLFKIFEALVGFFGSAPEPTGEAKRDVEKTALLISLVKGVELIFVAPLAFLVVVGIAKYSDGILSDAPAATAKHELQTVKSFIAALFVSVAAAHVVLESIAGDTGDPWAFAPPIALIIVLTVYIAVLERFSPVPSK